jgi:hypothetical protein
MNPQNLPIACNLHVFTPDERIAHEANVETVFSAITETRELPDGYALKLPIGMLMQVAQFIDKERLCCPFFHFTIDVAPESTDLWLHLTGSEDVKAFIATGVLPKPAEGQSNVTLHLK